MTRLPATGSDGERSIETQIRWASLPQPDREYRFAPDRLWRFDFAWPAARVALEVEGGSWTAGRHVRGQGFERDLEKYNEAGIRGWLVVRVTTEMFDDGRALALIGRALTMRPAA